MPRELGHSSKPIVKLRLSLGFDVRSFAGYLRMAKSSLAEIENGVRMFDAEKYPHVNDLTNSLERKKLIKDYKQDYFDFEDEQLKQYKKDALFGLETKLDICQRKLQIMERKHREALSVVENISLIDVTTTGKVGKYHRTMLDLSAFKQEQVLVKVGAVEQFKLRKRIELLKLEIEIITQRKR